MESVQARRVSPAELDGVIRRIYAAIAAESKSDEIMAADTWVAERASGLLGSHVSDRAAARSRSRLVKTGEVRNLSVETVTNEALKQKIENRRESGLKVPTLLTLVTRADDAQLPRCEHCGTVIEGASRSTRRFCAEKCRKAASRLRKASQASKQANPRLRGQGFWAWMKTLVRVRRT